MFVIRTMLFEYKYQTRIRISASIAIPKRSAFERGIKLGAKRPSRVRTFKIIIAAIKLFQCTAKLIRNE